MPIPLSFSEYYIISNRLHVFSMPCWTINSWWLVSSDGIRVIRSVRKMPRGHSLLFRIVLLNSCCLSWFWQWFHSYCSKNRQIIQLFSRLGGLCLFHGVICRQSLCWFNISLVRSISRRRGWRRPPCGCRRRWWRCIWWGLPARISDFRVIIGGWVVSCRSIRVTMGLASIGGTSRCITYGRGGVGCGLI